MPTAKERECVVTSIRSLPAALEVAIVGLTEEQLDSPGGEGEWAIRQVVHHLADANLNFFARTKWILSEERPVLKLFDREPRTRLPDATQSSVQASLLMLKGLHERWVILLKSMPDSAWNRAATHPDLGDVTLDDLLTSFAQHGETHLEQIRQTRQR